MSSHHQETKPGDLAVISLKVCSLDSSLHSCFLRKEACNGRQCSAERLLAAGCCVVIHVMCCHTSDVLSYMLCGRTCDVVWSYMCCCVVVHVMLFCRTCDVVWSLSLIHI